MGSGIDSSLPWRRFRVWMSAQALVAMVSGPPPQAQCWVSFQVRPDGALLIGTPLAEAAAWAAW